MNLFIFIIVLVRATFAQNIPVIRGIRPEKLHLYSSNVFKCDSKTIDSAYINDNYCDCKDGSDEPGTAACPEGRYYCQNKGYKSLEIFSSQVNDGVCDCCDGSDEYLSAVGFCQNSCRELAKLIEGDLRNEARVHVEGSKIKEQWIKEATEIRNQWEIDTVTKQKELDEIRPEWEKLKEKKEHEEGLEKVENDRRDALRTAAEELANKTLSESEEESGDKSDTTTSSDESADSEKESADSEKESADSEKESADSKDKTDNFPYPEEYRINNEEKDDADSSDNFPYPEEYRIKNEEKDEIIQDEDVKAEEEKEDEIIQDEDVKAGEEAEDVKPEEEAENASVEFGTYVSEAAKQARDEYNDVDNKKISLEKSIEEIKKNIDNDYGENDEFLKLANQCIDVRHREYNYQVCPYKNAKQGSTSIGNWDKLDDNRQVMKFTNGQKCWNGPERSLSVTLKCGILNKLSKVEEPGKCIYSMVMETPAACSKSHATALIMNLEMDNVEGDEY